MAVWHLLGEVCLPPPILKVWHGPAQIGNEEQRFRNSKAKQNLATLYTFEVREG